MIDYIKNLIFDYKLQNEIEELLIKYANGKTSALGIAYKLQLKDHRRIDYMLRKFKRKYKTINSKLLIDLIEYYQNILLFMYYSQKSEFYDPDDHLKIL